MLPHLQGRVFSRLQQFAGLPADLQKQVYELEVYLNNEQNVVFNEHHVKLVKSVRGVRAKDLLDRIATWIAETASLPATTKPQQTIETPLGDVERPASPVENTTPMDNQQSAVVVEASLASGGLHPSFASVAESLRPPTESQEDSRRQQYAKRLLDGLVLHGFITLYKEHDKYPPDDGGRPEELVYKDTDLLVPLSASITGLETRPTLNVWQLVNGAMFAAMVKHKAGLLAPMTQGKNVYAVVNGLLKSLTLFKTDVGRAPMVHFEAHKTRMSFDDGQFVHSVKVWDDSTTELINAETGAKRDALVQALLVVGVQYRESSYLDPTLVQRPDVVAEPVVAVEPVVMEVPKAKPNDNHNNELWSADQPPTTQEPSTDVSMEDATYEVDGHAFKDSLPDILEAAKSEATEHTKANTPPKSSESEHTTEAGDHHVTPKDTTVSRLKTADNDKSTGTKTDAVPEHAP